jgi:hypothetical protein
MEKTETKELITALCQAQKGFKSALKDATNPHFKKSYADLSAIWEACKEGLHQNGLVVSQQTVGTEQGWHLVTKVFHESGGFIESLTPIICQAGNPQSFGSGMTYARRYALAAILGIVTDDDDAEGAMNRKDANAQHSPPKAPAKQPEPAGKKLLSVAQRDKILTLLNHPTITRQEKAKMLLGINLMDPDRGNESIAKLEGAIAEREKA